MNGNGALKMSLILSLATDDNGVRDVDTVIAEVEKYVDYIMKEDEVEGTVSHLRPVN